MQELRNIKDIWEKFNFILTSGQKKWSVVIIVFTLVGALLETLGVSIIIPLVQVMLFPEELLKYEFVRVITETMGINETGGLIVLVAMGVIIVYLIKNLFLMFLSYIRIMYACKVQRELSTEMMISYMKRGYPFFLQTNTGEVLRGMTTSISSTYQALYEIFRMVAEVFTVISICIFVMLTDIIMASCIIVLAIFCLLIVFIGFRKWVTQSGKKFYYYMGVINKVLLQAFQGVKEVLVMNREEYFVEQYKECYTKQQKTIISKTIAAESPAYIIEAVCVIGLIGVVCIKAMTIDNAEVLVPQLAAFAMGAFRILPSLGRIASSFNNFMYQIPGVTETYDNFTKVRTFNTPEIVICDNEKVVGFEKMLELKNITWTYENGRNPVLTSLDLSIIKGQAIAFIGTSGAGKTTLADIILGLLKPQSGTIKMDGINIYDMKKSWSNIIGFVPQSVFLLDDTLRNNVAFALKEEEIDEEAVWCALEQAQMSEYVKNLPEGLDTMVGERGVRFSGGQRQRIVIARALYNNPDILVLDEATSALDTDTETAVMEAINSLHGRKTLIIIAHRLSTVKNCDIIYEIVDGKAIVAEKEKLYFVDM